MPRSIWEPTQRQVKGRHGVSFFDLKRRLTILGRKWEVDSVEGRQVAIAGNSVIFHVWEDEQQSSEFSP